MCVNKTLETSGIIIYLKSSIQTPYLHVLFSEIFISILITCRDPISSLVLVHKSCLLPAIKARHTACYGMTHGYTSVDMVDVLVFYVIKV